MIRKFALLFVVAILAAAPLRADDWKLTWSDEFDGAQLDQTKWTVQDEVDKYNKELEYYAPDEVYLEKGNLVLRSRAREYQGRHYTSGKVTTKGKFSQTYGRFEVRARLPRGKGMWPAHWLMPEDGSWPPEIDIMEMLGHQPGRIYTTNHWGTVKDHHHAGGHYDIIGPDSAADFHVYAVEWSPGLIRWSIDGQVCFESRQGVPDKPFYIILNTAVGGDWPGNPDAATPFPGYHLIDYVRVYRRDADIRPATVPLTHPSAQKPLAAGDIVLAASASDIDVKTVKVQFFQGQTLLGECAAPPYTLTWKNVPPGQYDLTAKVSDCLNREVPSAPVHVIVQ